jgi:hypothetical protein
MAEKMITKIDAMYKLGITSEKYFKNKCYTHKIKQVKRNIYRLKDIEFLNILPKKPKKRVIFYEPVYIETTYHIYESKMNYLNEL